MFLRLLGDLEQDWTF